MPPRWTKKRPGMLAEYLPLADEVYQSVASRLRADA